MKLPAKLAFLALALLFCACSWQSALAEKRIALILGNANYLRAPKLTNPENDASDLAEALRGLNFEVIYKTDADRRGLDIALEEFERRAQGADVAMFFFAGHGLQYRGSNFLLPIDADLEDEVSLRYNTLPLDKVRDALEAASGVKIMVLDACRNNPLASQIASRQGGRYRAVELTRGLARLDRTEGMVVAYATQADQVAQDGTGRNSPFSKALIRRIQEPNLEIATMFRRVAQDVYEQTSGRQRPELSISLLQDFYLTLRDDDSRVWRRISETAREQELQDFVAKFPSSPYVRDAQSRLYMLQSLRTEREAMNKRLAAIEAERDAFARREQEREKAEQQEKERRERENLLLERLAIERREREQQDLERREAERRVAEKRQREELEAARLLAERRERDQAEATKLAAEKLEKERLLAEARERDRIQAERLAAEQRERDRLAVAQLAHQRREQERSAQDKKEQERLAAERAAAEQEHERLAAEKRKAEEAEVRRLAEQKKETERLEKERVRIAALEQENRRKAEAEQQRLKQAEICSRENAEIARLTGEGQKTGLEALKPQLACPGLVATLDKAITEVLKAQEKACLEQRRALRKIGPNDLSALRVFLVNATCDEVSGLVKRQIASLEAEVRRKAAICSNEEERFAAIRDKDNSQRLTELAALQASMTCDALKPSVQQVLKALQPPTNTPEQVKSAQIELRRLGCYSGEATGAFEEGTRKALISYLDTKGVGTGTRSFAKSELTVSDELLKDLRGEPATVCRPEPTIVDSQKPGRQPVLEAPRRKRPVAVGEEDEDDVTAPPARRKAAIQSSRSKARPVATREEHEEETQRRRVPVKASAPPRIIRPEPRAVVKAAPRRAPAPVAAIPNALPAATPRVFTPAEIGASRMMMRMP